MTEFILDNKKLAYVLKSLKMCRNDYYRKLKKDTNREVLILDKPIDVDENIRLVDTLTSIEKCFDDSYRSVENITDNKELLKALRTLTDTQKEILLYVYVRNLTITEIATLLKKSRQTINQTHNLALSKIKKEVGV